MGFPKGHLPFRISRIGFFSGGCRPPGPSDRMLLLHLGHMPCLAETFSGTKKGAAGKTLVHNAISFSNSSASTVHVSIVPFVGRAAETAHGASSTSGSAGDLLATSEPTLHNSRLVPRKGPADVNGNPPAKRHCGEDSFFMHQCDAVFVDSLSVRCILRFPRLVFLRIDESR